MVVKTMKPKEVKEVPKGKPEKKEEEQDFNKLLNEKSQRYGLLVLDKKLIETEIIQLEKELIQIRQILTQQKPK